MKCEYCGRALSPEDWQCPGCGAPVEFNKEKRQEEETEKKEQAQYEKRKSKSTYMGGPNYNNYYENYKPVDRGNPLHISKYGNFMVRCVAEFVDLFIVALICEFIPGIEEMNWLIYMLYGGLCNSAVFHGATIGKRLMGLKVVDINFEELSIGRSIAREFSKFLSWIIIGFGFIMIMFSKRRQGLHDHIVGTFVIKARG